MTDGVGEFYSWPRIRHSLKRHGVHVARFLPPRLIPPTFYVNLRNHRKILVVDGEVGFTGGMNIGQRHIVDEAQQSGTADLHFCLRGPVVEQLAQVFSDDWQFVTGDSPIVPDRSEGTWGTVFARCISDGPNDDMDTLSSVIMAVISSAQQAVTIITPYFLPPAGLLSSMQSAAIRGIDVAIILPEKSNLRYVDWASRNMLWELLQYGVASACLMIESLYSEVNTLRDRFSSSCLGTTCSELWVSGFGITDS